VKMHMIFVLLPLNKLFKTKKNMAAKNGCSI